MAGPAVGLLVLFLEPRAARASRSLAMEKEVERRIVHY